MTIRPPQGLLLDCSNDPLTGPLEILNAGTQLRLSASVTDYVTFAVAADGQLVITTVDAGGIEGDICLMPDGDVGIGMLTPALNLDVRCGGVDGGIRIGRDTVNSVRLDLLVQAARTLVISFDDNAAAYVDSEFRAINHIFAIGSTERVRIAANGNMGIGTGATVDRRLHAEVSDAATNAITFAQRLSHITSGTPVAGFGTGIEFELEDNDETNLRVAAYITADWEDAGEGASADGRLNFGVMTGDAAAATAMSIWNGRLGVQVTTPAAQAHIDQSVDDAAIPVLTLDQADESDGFINFIGSDRGVIGEGVNSAVSVRVELAGVVYRLALYADA